MKNEYSILIEVVVEGKSAKYDGREVPAIPPPRLFAIAEVAASRLELALTEEKLRVLSATHLITRKVEGRLT